MSTYHQDKLDLIGRLQKVYTRDPRYHGSTSISYSLINVIGLIAKHVPGTKYILGFSPSDKFRWFLKQEPALYREICQYINLIKNTKGCTKCGADIYFRVQDPCTEGEHVYVPLLEL